MEWRNLLYFSKGERRALSLLLFLVFISFILLKVSKPAEQENDVSTISPDVANTHCVNKPETNKNIQFASTASYTRSTEKKAASKAKPERFQSYTTKYPIGTVIELNNADTTELKKIPGIGTAFANRIVKYRNLLGGYCTVEQLSEVYGIDEEKYTALSPWFKVNSSLIEKIEVNGIPADSLLRHPYLNFKQAKVIRQLRKQKGRLSGWDNLLLLEEFTEQDVLRLTPYLAFE